MSYSLRYIFFGIFLFVALQHFFIGILSKHKNVNIAFGVVSLVMAVSTFSVINMFKAANIANYLFWFNAIWVCPSIGGIFQILFVSYYTKIFHKPLLIFNIAISAICFILIFALPDGSIFSEILGFYIKNNSFGEPQAFINGHLSIFSGISYLYVTTTFLNIFIVLIKFYKTEQKKQIATIFIIAFAIRALLVLNDMIADVLPFTIYLLEYANLVLIIIMSIFLSLDIAKVAVLEENVKHQHEINNVKTELTQMLVHDLKNPLTAIIASTENGTGQQVKQAGNTMLNLIMNILDVSKFESQKMELRKTTISAQELIVKAKMQVEYSLKSKNIELKTIVDENFVFNIDIDLAVRVFVNIITNSIKYTQSNYPIEIRISKEINDFATITIKDNGMGIPADKLQYIFDKYEQADRSIAYSTGIGLSFCKMAVEAHGGSIGALSIENEGTTLWFTLPVTDEKPEKNLLVETKDIAISLNNHEKEQLKELYPLLKKLDVNEISAFKRIIKIIENKNLGNEAWREKLKNSVYFCNQELYSKLIELIIE